MKKIIIIAVVALLSSCKKGKECNCVATTDRTQRIVYQNGTYLKDSVYHVMDTLVSISPINTRTQSKECKSESLYSDSNGDVTHVTCTLIN